MSTPEVVTKQPAQKKTEVIVSPLDRARLQLAHERVLRTRAQLDLAQLAFNEAQANLRGVEQGIASEYNVTPKDSIDIDTGKITKGT